MSFLNSQSHYSPYALYAQQKAYNNRVNRQFRAGTFGSARYGSQAMPQYLDAFNNLQSGGRAQSNGWITQQGNAFNQAWNPLRYGPSQQPGRFGMFGRHDFRMNPPDEDW